MTDTAYPLTDSQRARAMIMLSMIQVFAMEHCSPAVRDLVNQFREYLWQQHGSDYAVDRAIRMLRTAQRSRPGIDNSVTEALGELVLYTRTGFSPSVRDLALCRVTQRMFHAVLTACGSDTKKAYGVMNSWVLKDFGFVSLEELEKIRDANPNLVT